MNTQIHHPLKMYQGFVKGDGAVIGPIDQGTNDSSFGDAAETTGIFYLVAQCWCYGL